MAQTQHPLSAIAEGFEKATGSGSNLFQSLNQGATEVARKIAGVTLNEKTQDDAPYFTNNEGIPWPDGAHSKSIGGVPLVSDTFLLQKQQTFNRSKNLERKNVRCWYLRWPRGS